MSTPNRTVVTRFAPSPTGYMHVGGVRTALYAWAFARQKGGTFILRIEDTDKEREVLGSIDHIVRTLHWLGLLWDEGVEKGGPHAPYLQSERLDHYRVYAQKLIDLGLAYPDPYTEAEVEVFRQEAEANKQPFLYRNHRPATTEAWDGTKPLRFKTPNIKRYEWQDAVRGELSAGEEALDDFILIKSDGYPTYNFAHIIDDLEMGVTHIMRGEEFISSTPKFLSLYEALSIAPPVLATMPVILAPDGKRKLSKRDGVKDVLDYKRDGFIPEAILNYLALLGWHPDGETELMTREEIVARFDLAHVQKGGAAFDETKLRWFNHEHLKQLSAEEYATRLTAYLEDEKIAVPTYISAVAPLLCDRAATLREAADLLTGGEFSFLHTTPNPTTELLLQAGKLDVETTHTHLTKVAELLATLPENVGAEAAKDAVFPYATEQGRGAVLWPLRTALSGAEKSPDPFSLIALLGVNESLARIAGAQAVLK